MTVTISGNAYVLYSMLKVSNVSLNIILREVYSYSESNNRYFTSDLENKLKQTYVKTVNSLRTNIHNKDGITHSLKTVQSIHIWIIYFPCPLFFTSHLFLLSHIYTGRDKALQITWTLCQYVINRKSQQFTVRICRAALRLIQCRQTASLIIISSIVFCCVMPRR